MKKKLLTLAILVIFCLSFLTGCNLFTIDTELDFKQVVAEVGDEDYKDQITKLDVLTAYINNASQYTQQGATAEQALELIYTNLVNRKILVQEAIKAELKKTNSTLTLKQVLTETADAKVSDNIKALIFDKDAVSEDSQNRLYNTAFNAVIKSENDQITKLVDQYKVEEDPDYVSSTAEATKRPTRPETDPKAPVKLDEMPDRANVIADGDSSEEKKEKEFRKRAYKSYVSSIENSKLFEKDLTAAQYMDKYFELMLVEQLQQTLMEEHSEILSDELIEELSKPATGTEVKTSSLYKDLQTRFDSLQSSQKQEFDASMSSNISKIEGLSDSTYVLYNVTEGLYGYVKHILLKFDDMATLDVAKINASDWSKSKKKFEREELKKSIVAKDLREEDEDKDFAPDTETKFTVNQFISFFDDAFGGQPSTKTPTVPGYADAPIMLVNKVPAFITGQEEAKLEGNDKWKDIASTADGFGAAVKDAFTDWEYAYSGDTGSLGSTTDMILNGQADPFLANQKYVAEFSDAARAVINEGRGAYTYILTDFGVHLILCTDRLDQAKYANGGKMFFPGDDAVTIITTEDSLISDDLKSSEVYKIYQVLKKEKTDKNYNDTLTAVIKKYNDDELVTKDEGLYKELLSYVKG